MEDLLVGEEHADMQNREKSAGLTEDSHAMSVDPVEPEVFREIMSTFPAGVTVVTAYSEDGHPQGLTINAFCCVSVSPPLVLVCVDNTSDTLPAIRHKGAFTVNFLAAEHEEIAMRFASKSGEKFDGLSHRPPSHVEGGPILDEDCPAHVVCHTWQSIEAGDHWIFVGQVREGTFDEEPAPLVYGARRFAGWPKVEEKAAS